MDDLAAEAAASHPFPVFRPAFTPGPEAREAFRKIGDAIRAAVRRDAFVAEAVLRLQARSAVRRGEVVCGLGTHDHPAIAGDWGLPRRPCPHCGASL